MDQREIRTRKAELQNKIDELMSKINAVKDNKEFMEIMDEMQQAKIEYNKLIELESARYNEGGQVQFDIEQEEVKKHM